MNWEQLFNMQQTLDSRIENEHGLQNEELFQKKVLALLVELGELANETRCFKFWSQKPASHPDIILEEYVDGLHFIMSLGLEKGYHYGESTLYGYETVEELTLAFQDVYGKVHLFQEDPSEKRYNELFSSFLLLGVKLGFSEEDIQKAYFDKNEKNHQRQEEGY